MYLWKIERTDDVGYEQNVAHIVAAETEMQARELAAGAGTYDERPGHVWYAPTTKIEAVGTAGFGQEPGIILTQNRGA